MFSRRPDRPKEEPRYAPPSTTSRPTDLVAVPVSNLSPQVWGASPMSAGNTPADAWPGVARGDATVIAPNDHLEGVLRSGQGVLVLGSFSGTIELETWVRMGEGSTVRADVTADEVVVAGQYEGRLVARGRLEIAATGHTRGDIETPRLQLHEGGVIDGALYMTHTESERSGVGGVRSATAPKPASVRGSSASGASPRQSVGSPGDTPAVGSIPVVVPAPGEPSVQLEPAPEIATRT